MNKYQEAYSYIKHYCELDDDFLKWPLAEKSMKAFKELVDKETPKKTKTKMNEHNHIDRRCPICDGFVYSFDKYCGNCGQRIRSDE